jgi:Xaa-Pro aminopeptidase
MAKARLIDVELPDFGMPEVRPEIPTATYQARLGRLRERTEAAGVDHLIVYADREHSANLAWVSGYDPRFEESLLVLDPAGSASVPAILVGNECKGLAAQAPLRMRPILFQDFSLPGQPRDRSRTLIDILSGEGIGTGSHVGLIGWKTYSRPDISDVPSYIVDELRALVGATGSVENATGLLIDNSEGLRTANEVEELAAIEFAACQTSEGVKNLILNLRPGLSESEAVALLGWNGTPLSCHLMLSAGPRAALGMLSPSDRKMQRGDQFTVAFGIWGALTCRAGFLVEGSEDLPAAIRDYVDRLVAPYFEAVAEWYEALHVGQTGGTLHDIVTRHIGAPFFGLSLNPGHMIGLDEWVNSPVAPGSSVELRSGSAWQVDIIPGTGTDYFTTNIEDGIALADGSLRKAFATAYPDAWRRVQARRAFMEKQLGIVLHADVMPFSNIPAFLPPFLLSPGRAMSVCG